MLADPSIRAVVPPWGGVTSIDLLDRIGWDEAAGADPTWVVGYSDTTTWMLPLRSGSGWATLHGTNLLDTPYRRPDGLAHWTDLASATDPVVTARRRCPSHRRVRRLGRRPGHGGVPPRRPGDWSPLDHRSGGRDRSADRRLHRDGHQPRRHAVRRSPGVGGAGSRRARSSTSRPATTTRSRSAATCTASGWPAGSTTPARW